MIMCFILAESLTRKSVAHLTNILSRCGKTLSAVQLFEELIAISAAIAYSSFSQYVIN